MRDIRLGTCPRCEHNEIIEAAAFDVRDGNVTEPEVVVGVRAWRAADCHDYGPLTRYVCRGCGYTQIFAANAAEIPIGKDYGTRLVQGPPKPPYR